MALESQYIFGGLDMDVDGGGLSKLEGGKRVVSRPHLPAFPWYGCWAMSFGTLSAIVFRMAIDDGSLAMFVPNALFLLFCAPLFLALRNLTTVAIIDAREIELRRFFVCSWRLQRVCIFHASPTPGIIEGPLHLNAFGSPVRKIPGYLVRGMRGTWMDDLHSGRSSKGLDGMSPEERDQLSQAIFRSSAQGREANGSVPEHSWRRSILWVERKTAVAGVSVGLMLASLLLSSYRGVWALDVLLVFISVGIAIDAGRRPRGPRQYVIDTGLVLISLLPGFVFSRGQLDWQVLDPGLGTIALYLAGAAWVASMIPPSRDVVPVRRGSPVVLSIVAFGALAFWAYRMLTFANMEFDRSSMPAIQIVSVLRVEEDLASRYKPSGLTVDLAGSTNQSFGMTARFADDSMLARNLMVGGQCVLMIHPGLFHLRWLEITHCDKPKPVHLRTIPVVVNAPDNSRLRVMEDANSGLLDHIHSVTCNKKGEPVNA